MELGFPNGLMIVVFHIQRENESLVIHPSKVYSLECYKYGSNHQAKTLGVQDLQSIQACSSSDRFRFGNIQIASMSLNLQIYIILWYLKPFIYIVLDLEIPRDKSMHPMRSKAWKQSNLWFPTIGIKALGQVLTCQICSSVW